MLAQGEVTKVLSEAGAQAMVSDIVKDLGGLDEGRGRLRLGSSHRKPVPARS